MIRGLGDVEGVSEAREAQLSTKDGLRPLTLQFLGVETSSSLTHNIAFPNLKKLHFESMHEWKKWECKKALRSKGGDGSSTSTYSSSKNTFFSLSKNPIKAPSSFYLSESIILLSFLSLVSS